MLYNWITFCGLILLSNFNHNQKAAPHHAPAPKISFTFDDGITNDILSFPFETWNQKILDALQQEHIRAVFFVTGSNKMDKKGRFLLQSWANDGHRIANHSFTHPNFSKDEYPLADFESELLRTDSIISAYPTYLKLFRFPYLKEGKTREKIDGIRQILARHGYRNGHVTIDASDWFVNSELIKCIQKHGKDAPQVEQFKQFYIQHLFERAQYYESLSYELNQRHISHTLLLHHNLAAALFLGDLIQKFKAEAWEVTDADKAFEDEIFQHTPATVPAGESLIWSMAKAAGKYDDQLRYPAEDSRYELPKMLELGLIVK
ncbi:MAG: polysaccharide deacetylase family protein [Saprospiraceae bacterium]|nr:polysaccharide deacetylase family protein [Saprospiraceae bacterium]